MLRRAHARAPLLAALQGVQRLVLLGDTLELRQGPLGDALAAARPVLERIAAALPNGAEVVIVPGNHDHRLLCSWSERKASDGVPPMGLETAIDWRDGEPLALLAGCLGPARVRASYPGVWLRDDVYATHGHYGDRHTTVPQLERLGAGVTARIVGDRPGGPISAEDYEATLAPMYAWIDAVAQHAGWRFPFRTQTQAWSSLSASDGRRSLRRRGMAAAFPVAIAALSRAGLGPLRADVSGVELRRAGLAAFGEVVQRLGVDAQCVIFGHTHRAGPVPGDDRSEWGADGGVELLNAGCWVHEPAFLGAHPERSPYRAGFAALLGNDADPPELVNLLDGFPV